MAEAIDRELAAEALDGISTDAEADALLERLDHGELGLWEAFEARDVERVRRYASGARWRSVVPVALSRAGGRAAGEVRRPAVHPPAASRR